MKKLALLLCLASSFTLFAKDIQPPMEDMLYQCDSPEMGIEGGLHGVYHSVWTLRQIQIYPTKDAQTFLVRDGINDLNNEGIFQLDEAWQASLVVSGKTKTFRSKNDSKKFVAISSDNTAKASGDYGDELKCEFRPY